MKQSAVLSTFFFVVIILPALAFLGPICPKDYSNYKAEYDTVYRLYYDKVKVVGTLGDEYASVYNGIFLVDYGSVNMGKTNALSRDLPKQAKALIEGIRKMKNLNFKKDWKIVNILVGSHDLCEACRSPHRYSAHRFRDHIAETLDILLHGLPRTLVNLIEPFDLNVIRDQMYAEQRCRSHLRAKELCPCQTNYLKQHVVSYASQYSHALRDLIDTKIYDGYTEFAVVLQPFFRDFAMPRTSIGAPDFSYFASDCLQLSKKGQTAFGTALWNSMLEPVNSKPTSIDFTQTFRCPQEMYIHTRLFNKTAYAIRKAAMATTTAKTSDGNSLRIKYYLAAIPVLVMFISL